jgi:hypothetical protein
MKWPAHKKQQSLEDAPPTGDVAQAAPPVPADGTPQTAAGSSSTRISQPIGGPQARPYDNQLPHTHAHMQLYGPATAGPWSQQQQQLQQATHSSASPARPPRGPRGPPMPGLADPAQREEYEVQLAMAASVKEYQVQQRREALQPTRVAQPQQQPPAPAGAPVAPPLTSSRIADVAVHLSYKYWQSGW